jgi:ribonucleoside-diphosphate reductase alpha chain
MQLFKRRCGVGIDISSLRPAGSEVANAAQTTSGAVSFMERFSNTTREVAQNGRRGALMLTMDIAHPDVKDFITVKQDLTKVTGANVSVRISDEFMNAVEKGETFTQRWPIDAEKPSVTKEVDARELWNELIQCAHSTAEPGVIFWDRQHYYSTSSVYPGFKNVSTNPCSEIAMQGGDSCRLIALNLYSFVEEPFTEKARFDKEKFYRVTYEAQRLMDDLVDLELEAIERIIEKIQSDPEDEVIKANELATWRLLHETGMKGRRTGLGFTALSDALAALGLAFDSQEAIDAVEEIMQAKLRGEFDSSIDMALERGKFEIFDPKVERTSEFVQMMKKDFPAQYKRMMKFGRRNISISTVAPTGTLSLLAQTSSGIEPLFMTSYTRRRKLGEGSSDAKVAYVDDMGDRWEEFTVYHPKLKEWMRISGEADEAKSPYAGCTAGEIDWKKRIELQAVIQKYVTHSISSTINLPAETPVELVDQIYREAWQKGLKGITVYRDGSRSGVLIGKEEKKEEMLEDLTKLKRPKKLRADVIRFYNEHEAWIAVIGIMNDRPYEIFTGKAQDAFYLPQWVDKGWVIKKRKKSGQARYDFQYVDKEGYRVTIEGLSRSFNPEYWNYAKLISGVLRHGMPLEQVVDLIADLKLYDESINTWKNGVARALKKFIPDGTTTDHQCPECGDPQGLVYEEGCLQCKNCGHSKCG